MKSYIHPDYLALLTQSRLAQFQDLWQLERNWFEAPNRRRKGLSGVCRKTLMDPNTGNEVVFFVKYQENHCHRDWRHPVQGSPTGHREAANLLRFQRHGLPTPKLVYYNQKIVDGQLCSILITEELRGESFAHYLRRNSLDAPMIDKIAELLFKLHVGVGFEHRSLCAKHIWIQDDQPLLIDLEKARPRRWWRPWRDLELLFRHLKIQCHVAQADCLLLLRRYLKLRRKPSRMDGLASRFKLLT